MANDDYGDGLAIPPMDTAFLSDQPLTFPDFSDLNDDVFLDDHDFDFSIDDLLNDSFDLTPFDPAQFSTNPEFKNSDSSQSKSDSGDHPILLPTLPSPESNGFKNVLEESQGSGNCGSNDLEAGSIKGLNSVTSSPNSDNNLITDGVVHQSISLDGHVKNEGFCVDNVNDNGNGKKNGVLKRKKDIGDYSNANSIADTNSSKYRKSSDSSTNDGGHNVGFVSEEEKMKARLLRNRESAQLSRQRRKHYVEELEGKVRSMNSTIHDLNAKISYIMTENASLKQQMGGGVVPSSMALPPGMYPPPPMMYSWMPAPPYMVNPHGSQVPLLPIPRIKSQQLAAAPKISKKSENKKSQVRTKKVASVSFLGLLFFMLLFGGLVPMVNVRYGGMKDSLMGRSDVVGNGHYEKHHGRVLTVSGDKFSKAPDTNSKFNCARRDHSEGELGSKQGGCGFVGEGNGSEPLMASLYVPRNDKLVKIDGNLIIHSILASEKATKPGEDQRERTNDETGLALVGDLVPSDPRMNAGRHPHLALGSRGESENLKTTAADHQLHQWFREGLAGPMLSSGKCTEVFQFDVVSAPGAILSATSARNVSTASTKNSSNVSKGRNRRILHGLPIPLPGSTAYNISEEGTESDAANGNFSGTNSSSSMVVSLLMDPREAATEVDGVMRVKSLSRIFVVVLIDGVKYVTYSCMFPFKGAAVPHLAV